MPVLNSIIHPPHFLRMGYGKWNLDFVAIRLKRHSGRTERREVKSVVRQAHHPEQRRRGIQEEGIISQISGFRIAPRYTGLGWNDGLILYCSTAGRFIISKQKEALTVHFSSSMIGLLKTEP